MSHFKIHRNDCIKRQNYINLDNINDIVTQKLDIFKMTNQPEFNVIKTINTDSYFQSIQGNDHKNIKIIDTDEYIFLTGNTSVNLILPASETDGNEITVTNYCTEVIYLKLQQGYKFYDSDDTELEIYACGFTMKIISVGKTWHIVNN